MGVPLQDPRIQSLRNQGREISNASGASEPTVASSYGGFSVDPKAKPANQNATSLSVAPNIDVANQVRIIIFNFENWWEQAKSAKLTFFDVFFRELSSQFGKQVTIKILICFQDFPRGLSLLTFLFPLEYESCLML